MDINKLLDKARKSVSDFCINECNAFCCRKGQLILNKDEVSVVTQGTDKELVEKGDLVWLNEEKASLSMGGKDTPCPSLDKDNKCLIHKNKKRNIVCKQFPIFLDGNVVRISSRCLALRENKFYSYEKKLISLGYKVEKGSTAYDPDFYNKIV